METIVDRTTQQAATEIIRQLIAVSTRLFGGIVGIQEKTDPEFPGDKCLMFIVETTLDPKMAAARELDWIREVEAIAPGWEDIRLSVRFA
jgi:hypothetical protein